VRIVEQDRGGRTQSGQCLEEIVDDISRLVTGINDRQIHTGRLEAGPNIEFERVTVDLGDPILKTLPAIHGANFILGQGKFGVLTAQLLTQSIHREDADATSSAEICRRVPVIASKLQDDL
jgi:hypothetical protein